MKRIFSLVLMVVLVASCCSLIACNKIADNTQFYDSVTKTLKLSKQYDGKSFISDGIGKATVDTYTDGDTTRFRLAQGDVISIRYYQIDTPESTGGVEKWGKAASNFVEKQLGQPGTEIVLEATKDKAEKDSYGTRYLGYVWYRNSADAQFKNLNLEIVENGFSANTGINTSEYPYYSYFEKAQNFAKSIQLRIYSELDDPLFTDDPMDITLKQFAEFEKAFVPGNDKEGNKEANLDFYNPESKSGGKVRVEACLTSLYISDSGTHTYTASAYDSATGETYTLNVYTMYGNASASELKVGHLYTIIGDIQLYYGKFQLSGIKFSEVLPIKNGTTLKQSNYYLTFDSSIDWIKQYSATLYSDITVTEVQSVANGKLTFTGTANQAKYGGYQDAVKTFTFTVTVPESYSGAISVGTTLSVRGYQYVANSGEITIINYSDITIK